MSEQESIIGKLEPPDGSAVAAAPKNTIEGEVAGEEEGEGFAATSAADADLADEEEEEEEYVEDLPVANEDYDPALVLELGDRIYIQCAEYGKVWGTVYYRDNTLLRLKPEGGGNVLYDFERDYDPEKKIDAFAEKYGVEASYILNKRKHADFVTQQDFQVGQTLAGILPNGKTGPFYKIKKIYEDDDAIKLVNLDDEEETMKLRFKFKGIPLSLDFRILRIAAPPGVDLKKEQAKAKAAAVASAGVPAGQEKVAEEEEEIGEWDEDLQVQEDDEYELLEEGTTVLPQQRVVREAAASKKVVPENLQKADAINDFLNMLDKEDRKDPKAIRERRILVETLHYMKRAITDYKADGTVKGVKKPSVSTLFELLQRVDVPMGRAVLDIEKRLYADPSLGKSESDTSEANKYFMIEDVMAKPQLKDKQSGPVSALPSAHVDTGKGASNQINHYMNEQITYEQQERPWKAGTSSGPDFEIRKDLLFFRSAIPDIADAGLDGYTRSGPKDKETGEIPYPEIGQLFYGVETALTTTYRKGQRGEKVPLLNDESAPLNAYLLFPAQMASFLGTKRSGSLALDVMRGKEAMIWISAILQILGVIQEVNKVTHIVPLKVEGGNLAANIPLTDYLEGLELPGTGLGDMLIDLGNYGLNKLELTPEIIRVLQTKMNLYQGQIITSINAMRTSLKELQDTPPVANPMLPIESTNILDAFVREEPLLVEMLKKFESQNPILKLSDIARVAYLVKYNADFYQAVIGKQVALMVEERNRTIKTRDLQDIINDEIIKRNRANRGLPPKPNTCEHVAKLVTIRKLKDEGERYYALTRFLGHYQGGRKDNWITCNVCNLELLCVHERLLIKAFLSPLEREVVFKEINLNFSGGIFQGHYICRSCGQPIQEIDYDTGLQFDEKGRPMIGRAVIKDEDPLSAKEIETIIMAPIKKAEEFEFTDPDQAMYYKIVRELAERVGIFMERPRYKKVIKYLNRFMDFYPDRESFNADDKAYKKQHDKKYKAEIEAGKKKAYKIRNYDTIISKTSICAAAIMLLYEIQTHIPDYVPQYSLPGCDAGFGGYPLQEDVESRQGLTYMACAISSISREEEPWISAEFYKPVKSGKKEEQLASILTFMRPIWEDIAEKITSLQQMLVDKRVWKTEQLGVKGQVLSRPKDSVPSYFLPELILPTVAEAAAEPIGEGAVDARAISRAWIRNAHELAQRNSKPIRGSPFADITCCKIPITNPGSFWKAAASLSPMPLGGRLLTPSKRPPVQQFHFESRVQEDLVQEMSKDLTYRLFMKVCYDGDRKGRPHEPGYTHLCHSCNFQFPMHPSIVDPDEAKTAIAKQNIDTNLETFEDLLNTVHHLHEVAPYSLGAAEEWQTTVEDMLNLKHEPLEDWSAMFRRMIRRLNRLKKEDEITPATVAATLAEKKTEDEITLPDAVAEAEAFVKVQFSKKIKWEKPIDLENRHRILDIIAELPWHNFIQVLETYFVKVGKNILFQYQSENLMAYRNSKLAQSGMANIMDALTADNSVLKAFGKEFNSPDKQFAQLKLAKFILQLSEIIRFKNRIRPIYFVGGMNTFKYIQAAFLYGPLKELFDSSINPFDDKDAAAAGLPSFQGPPPEEKEEEEEGALVKRTKKKTPAKSIADTSMTLLVRVINATIVNFKKYQMNFDDEHLREVLAERAEKEKQGFIAKSKTMSDEEIAIFRMQRKLKIGRFAKDVKSQVQGYDIDQINLEEEENAAAGIVTSLDQPGDIDDPVAEGWKADAAAAERTEEDIEQDQAYDIGGGGLFDDEEVD